MKTKHLVLAVLALMIMPVVTPEAHASAAKAAGASLFLPTTGQAMNGQIGNTKTKLMAVAEVGLVTTTAILWFGLLLDPSLPTMRGARRMPISMRKIRPPLPLWNSRSWMLSGR